MAGYLTARVLPVRWQPATLPSYGLAGTSRGRYAIVDYAIVDYATIETPRSSQLWVVTSSGVAAVEPSYGWSDGFDDGFGPGYI